MIKGYKNLTATHVADSLAHNEVIYELLTHENQAKIEEIKELCHTVDILGGGNKLPGGLPTGIDDAKDKLKKGLKGFGIK